MAEESLELAVVYVPATSACGAVRLLLSFSLRLLLVVASFFDAPVEVDFLCLDALGWENEDEA